MQAVRQRTETGMTMLLFAFHNLVNVPRNETLNVINDSN
jgi:hypothetical protein